MLKIQFLYHLDSIKIDKKSQHILEVNSGFVKNK